MADSEQIEEHHLDFTTLAKQIDSKIDTDFIKQLKELEKFNILLKLDLFGNEEVIPVGSCVDGSKVTVPGDSGDIDMLVVSNRVILKEYLFDYDNAYPAFLHIRVNKEHEKYFKTVKDPIEGVYLPTSVLKELQEKLFFMSKVWMNSETQEGLSNDGNFVNVTRTSAVGKEQTQLYPDEQCAFEFKETPETLTFKLKRMEKFLISAAGGILHLAKNTEEMDDEDGSSTSETHYRSNSRKLDNTSLFEGLNDLLDIFDGRETGDSNTGNISDMNKDRQADADNGNCGEAKKGKGLDSDGNENESETKHNYSRSDPKLNHNCEQKNAMDSDSMGEKESSTTDTCIKKSTQHGTSDTVTSFSKFKSTDFVPAYKFEGWPRVADEWLIRKRKWPSKIVLKRVLESGCQVVAKRPLALSNKPVNEDRDPYFRLSFAISEIILAQSMKEQQLLCWRVLKAYQKCFFETNPKCLTSYHWKNVVFWVSEDLDESFWTDENVFMAVLKCLDYMKHCLQNRRLPFYFVRKMNLFNGYDETSLDRLGKQVEEIRGKPLEFLKRFNAEPPTSERHFIDIDEMKDMLSEKTKAHDEDRFTEEAVDAFINLIQSSFKRVNEVGLDFEQIYKSATHLLKIARSEIEERSTHVSKDNQSSIGLEEKVLDMFEKSIKSMQHEGEEPNDENGEDSESFADVFSTLSSALTDMKKDDGSSGNTDNVLAIFKKLAMKMQVVFQSKNETCDQTDEIEGNEANGILSSFKGAFQTLFEAINTSTENEDENVNFVDELRKVINEASRKFGEATEREEKNEKKSEMDIDLD